MIVEPNKCLKGSIFFQLFAYQKSCDATATFEKYQMKRPVFQDLFGISKVFDNIKTRALAECTGAYTVC